jgi:hypothetical protein
MDSDRPDQQTAPRHAVVCGLTDGSPYLFRVAATNAAGRGPWSRTILAILSR